ncbi:MAG: methylated-DNA--[protein]-cysteine S-methyltransferase [Pseudomonadota bacterium]
MNNENTSNFDFVLPSPVGNLGLNLSSKGITNIVYLQNKAKVNLPKKGLALKVYQQLVDYFELRRNDFDLPLDIQGTPYQKKVWNAVSRIPYGKSSAYGDIANKIHSGPRAVGNACRHNPVPILIPCHRVVKKNGLGGYCGSIRGTEIQQKDWLLQHEQIHNGD